MARLVSTPARQPTPKTELVQTASISEQNMNVVDPAADEQRSAVSTARVRALNDRFRQTGAGGRMLMTAGIAALPRDEQLAIVAAVMAFEVFDTGNDPHREHDFGALRVGAHRVMFKVDYYDRSERVHSPDPSDAAVTCRVLTIMLAEEY